jgi:hypothetical protein
MRDTMTKATSAVPARKQISRWKRICVHVALIVACRF